MGRGDQHDYKPGKSPAERFGGKVMGIKDTAAAAVGKPVTWGVAMVIILTMMGSALAITGSITVSLMVERYSEDKTAQGKVNDTFAEGLKDTARALNALADKQTNTDRKSDIANIRLDNHDREIQRLHDGR